MLTRLAKAEAHGVANYERGDPAKLQDDDQVFFKFLSIGYRSFIIFSRGILTGIHRVISTGCQDLLVNREGVWIEVPGSRSLESSLSLR